MRAAVISWVVIIIKESWELDTANNGGVVRVVDGCSGGLRNNGECPYRTGRWRLDNCVVAAMVSSLGGTATSGAMDMGGDVVALG